MKESEGFHEVASNLLLLPTLGTRAMFPVVSVAGAAQQIVSHY